MTVEPATAPQPAVDVDDAHPSLEDEEPRGTRLDAWWAWTLRTPLRQRFWYWGGPLGVTLLALILRTWDLGNPHSLVFDETFYVKDGWTLWHNGYESTWPADADQQFAAGKTNIFNDAAEYVVHPPLGKWIIGAGMMLFGADNSFSWRIGTAVVGTLGVLLITLIARRLFHSTLIGVIAGFLFAIDGHAIVLSRVGLLDVSVMFFGLLGFGAMLLDRTWTERRLSRALERRALERGTDAGPPDWGPALWWRPWLMAAGLSFGLMSAVKWSGLFMLTAFGIYAVVVDALARRRLGIPFWASAAILKQGPISFLLMVPIAVATYLASWTGWFLTSGGYYRTWANEPGQAWTGPLAWVPHSLQSLWHYHSEAYGWNVGLHTPHPYQANPLTWLFMVRPTSMYYLGTDAKSGCNVSACSDAITSIANPIIWYAAVIALFYLVYRLARYREWRVGFILMGMVGAYLPWLAYTNRTVFQFYTIAFEPYLILALTFVIALILGRRDDPTWRRTRGIGVVGAFLIVSVLVTVFFWPLWTGERIPFWYWQLHIWLPSWR
ncbi:phospholipid carrier-dependent glycosyltransferase [Glaciibacter flavus]|uniref:Polyprenol-phosphate-mannose--protein mannosyltransferase n=1 Tax=Orlajensenia flava TaxID=2565934 RepID=A0A4S4FYL5_9MICO|nr:phospholipid carrier-dependent glycosyltransferase [Glaciibacter flavus]THG36160.1 phospholipid carrier-dependent glycosyltransferase [Glaciibacter flavus]